jgi:hypothetical protein
MTADRAGLTATAANDAMSAKIVRMDTLTSIYLRFVPNVRA